MGRPFDGGSGARRTSRPGCESGACARRRDGSPPPGDDGRPTKRTAPRRSARDSSAPSKVARPTTPRATQETEVRPEAEEGRGRCRSRCGPRRRNADAASPDALLPPTVERRHCGRTDAALDRLHLNDIQMEGSHNATHRNDGGLIPPDTTRTADRWEPVNKACGNSSSISLLGTAICRFTTFLGNRNHLQSLPECSNHETWYDAHQRHAPLWAHRTKDDSHRQDSGHTRGRCEVARWAARAHHHARRRRGHTRPVARSGTRGGWPTLAKRGAHPLAFIEIRRRHERVIPIWKNASCFPRTVDDFRLVLLDNAENSEAEIAGRRGRVSSAHALQRRRLRLGPAVLAPPGGGAQCLSGDVPIDSTSPRRALPAYPVRAPAGCTAAAVERSSGCADGPAPPPHPLFADFSPLRLPLTSEGGSGGDCSTARGGQFIPASVSRRVATATARAYAPWRCGAGVLVCAQHRSARESCSRAVRLRGRRARRPGTGR